MSSKARIFRTISGGLQCWNCKNTSSKDGFKKLEMVYGGMFSRWQCKRCGATFKLDERPMPDPIEQKFDPAARKYARLPRRF